MTGLPAFPKIARSGHSYFDVSFNFSKAFELNRAGRVPARIQRGPGLK